ncbi:MAG: hypothetical protein ACRET2_08745 [Steroidobacteraceae bacterium]
MPTAAARARARLPTDLVYDGINLLPYLNGQNDGIPNPKLYWRDGVDFAMRDADSKLWICAIAPHEAASADPDDEPGFRRKPRRTVPALGRARGPRAGT